MQLNIKWIIKLWIKLITQKRKTTAATTIYNYQRIRHGQATDLFKTKINWNWSELCSIRLLFKIKFLTHFRTIQKRTTTITTATSIKCNTITEHNSDAGIERFGSNQVWFKIGILLNKKHSFVHLLLIDSL